MRHGVAFKIRDWSIKVGGRAPLCFESCNMEHDLLVDGNGGCDLLTALHIQLPQTSYGCARPHLAISLALRMR